MYAIRSYYVAFSLTPAEQADIRWYVEDYLELAEITEEILVTQVEELMARRNNFV